MEMNDAEKRVWDSLKDACRRGEYEFARRKYEDFAKRNHMPAQYNLGLMYKNGVGVPRDYGFAYMWLNIAALNGDESSAKERNGLEKEMTKTDVAKAQRLSQELYHKISKMNRK